jgi:hypothetical protein
MMCVKKCVNVHVKIVRVGRFEKFVHENVYEWVGLKSMCMKYVCEWVGLKSEGMKNVLLFA